MLKQGVEAVAVRESVRVRYALEGERLEIHEPEEERNIREHRNTHPRHELSVLRAIKEYGDGAVSRQHPTPKQQRSRLPAPQGSKPVVQGHRARGVSRDITKREVIRRKRPEERQHRRRSRSEDQQH